MSRETPSLWIPEKDPVRLAALGKLAEECGELSAIIARCIIQGVEERDPDTGESNRNALRNEMADVLALMRVCDDVLNLLVPLERMERKVEHKRKWLEMLREASSPG